MKLIQGSGFIEGEDGPKRLDLKILDLILNKELTALENQPVKICHKSSKLMNKPTNQRDSNHLAAYGFCNFRPECPVNSTVHIKINLQVEVINKHDHANVTIQIRGQDRINLCSKIMAENLLIKLDEWIFVPIIFN